MGFSQSVVEKALLSCGRHCSICHKFCGTKIELHHIKQKKDGGDDTFDNCLPLCFDCHADVMQYNPDHPKGKRYNSSELKKHRNNWYKKVELSGGLIITNTNYREIDKKTFERLNELLPSKDLMYFIKHNGFSGKFNDNLMIKTDTFLLECELPEFEFLDADLEGGKSELQIHFEKLDKLLYINTFGAGHDKQSIPREWEEEQPERFKKAITEISEVSSILHETYDSFIRLARRKLYSD